MRLPAPPPPVRCRALIDAGSSRTAVDASVLGALRLGIAQAFRSTQAVAGQAFDLLSQVRLSILDFSRTASPMRIEPDMTVVELASPIPGIDVLIGMDVLKSCRTTIDGPAGVFALEW